MEQHRAWLSEANAYKDALTTAFNKFIADNQVHIQLSATREDFLAQGINVTVFPRREYCLECPSGATCVHPILDQGDDPVGVGPCMWGLG